MDIKFEDQFLKALEKYSSIKKFVKKKVDMIIENPITIGEPLKGNWQGFYSCPVKRNFIIIYLYCAICRKKNNNDPVGCSDCSETPDETLKFVLLGPHDQTYKSRPSQSGSS
ncbi:MAG: type II toxin-antitoxin system mRNA interferase toxin, RelE/StbE family [Desulfobacterales bacterium]|nr:type II toxin-antitoxin system mRNA interferase toxin, RelE/StbE family [Desulfobacterales bacterium]